MLISEKLVRLSEEVSDIQTSLDTFIKDTYDSDKHSKQFPTCPSDIFTNATECQRVRKDFCDLTDDGKHRWIQYETDKEQAVNQCSVQVATIMETEFGMNAIHTGNPPHHFPTPGGQQDQGY